MTTTSTLHASVVMATVLLCATLAQAQGSQLFVSNVQVQQRPTAGLVDITYDLETVGNSAATVSLFLSIDSGEPYSHYCENVVGDAGPGVLPGSGKHIVWNAGAEFPQLISSTCALRVTADDSPYLGNFKYIPPGTFNMGSPLDEPGRRSNEVMHAVTITQGFYIASTEVTQEWWYEVMDPESSTSQFPQAHLSWDLAVAFCNQLSLNEGLTPAYSINGPSGDVTWNRVANGYRLPTEAEWEYACRAGSQSAFCNGPITSTDCTLDPHLDQVGWYCGNGAQTVQGVGQKNANAWGLYDMHGNLWEWVWDGFRDDYQNLPSVDPVNDVGPGSNRVLRGGYYRSSVQYCRSAHRGANVPYASTVFGFRPVRMTN